MAKLGEGLEFKYESIIPQAPMDMKFHYWDELEDGTKVLKIHSENFKLITDIEELKTYIEKCKDKRIAFDTETTGLTYGEDKIVGFSISLDRWSGFYVPIRHKVAHTVSEMVDRLDENGNQVILKSGRVSRTKKVTKTYTDYEHNINPKEALDVLYQILTGAKRVIMHNSEFDLNMLKFEGYDVTKIRAFDNLILPYLFDPEATGMAGLKKLEQRVLGRTVPEFKEILGKGYDSFAEVNPEQDNCVIYTVCDTAGLIGVYEEMFPMVQNLLKQFKNPLVIDGEPYNVLVKDNQMVKMFVDYYGHCKILIDREKAIKYKENLEEEQRNVTKEVYSYFDRGVFNLARSKEFEEAMRAKNIFTGVLTEKGAPSWNKKAIEEMKRNMGKLKECLLHYKEINYVDSKLSKIGMGYTLATMLEMYGNEYFNIVVTKNDVTVRDKNMLSLDRTTFWLTVKELYKEEMKKIHILDLIQRNNSLNKALNSYVDKLTQVDECVMHYRLKGTKSGRLSSGNGSKGSKSKNHYYIDLNAQNLTKPKSGYYRAEKCSEDDPESILGWKFTPLADDYALSHLEEEYIVEGQDPNITIRGCLKAPEGRYVVSLDYDAEEMKVLCLLSGDHLLYDIFKKGDDPHERTAIAIWGVEHYDKGKRKKAKITNFLSAYGGGASTLSQSLDIPLEEAEDIIQRYYDAYHEMAAWKLKKVDEMYQNNGIVFTPFGRPRNFKGWIDVIDENRNNYDNLLEKDRKERASMRVQAGIERRVTNHIVQGCLQGHVRILTNKGYIKIEDLFNMQKSDSDFDDMLVYTGTKWAPFEVVDMGKAKKAKLYLKGGMTLDCDERHQVFCHRGIINNKQLEKVAKVRYVKEIGSRHSQICVLKSDGIDFPEVLPEIWTSVPGVSNAKVITITKEILSDVWYWIGYFIGDGSWCGHDSEYPNKYKKAINYHFGRHEEIKAQKCIKFFQQFELNPSVRYLTNNIGGKSICVTVYSAGFIDYMVNVIGVPYGCHFDTKEVPEVLFKSPLKHRLAFIEGLMDSDGCRKYGNIHMKNYKLLNQVRQICDISGIPTRLHSPESRKCGTTALNLGGKYGGIGDKSECKSPHGKDTRYGARSFSKFEIYDEEVQTYTLTVFDDEHRFVSDGIISKNCCGDILRLVLYKLYKKYFKNRDPHIDFMSTVHDEINYTIDKEVTTQYVKELEEIMTFDILDKTLPITTSTDIGFTYGNMYPFVWEDEAKTILIPKRVHHA